MNEYTMNEDEIKGLIYDLYEISKQFENENDKIKLIKLIENELNSLIKE